MTYEKVNAAQEVGGKHLEHTLARVDDEKRVLDSSGITVHLKAFKAEASLKYSLDLIGHSVSSVLQVGTWSVDGVNQECKDFADFMNQEATWVSAVRLLGCSTAKNAGMTALLALRGLLKKAKVGGTTVPISASDFGPAGLTNENAVGYLAAPAPPNVNASATAAWYQALGGRGDSTQRTRESILQVFEDHRSFPGDKWKVGVVSSFPTQTITRTYRSAPGLLARPDAELIVGDPSQPLTYVRFTILLGYEVVRTYLPGNPLGVLHLVHDRAALKAAVDGAEHVTPPDRVLPPWPPANFRRPPVIIRPRRLDVWPPWPPGDRPGRR